MPRDIRELLPNTLASRAHSNAARARTTIYYYFNVLYAYVTPPHPHPLTVPGAVSSESKATIIALYLLQH